MKKRDKRTIRCIFDSKEDALAWAEQEGMDMRYLEAYQGPFLGDTTWVIGVWPGPDEPIPGLDDE